MKDLSVQPARKRYSGFDALRLIAALGVLWSHSYAMRGVPLSEPIFKATDGMLNGGMLSVSAFFAISGYLVTQSFAARADGTQGWLWFLRARALRIMPGLLACLLVTVVVCAFVTTLDAASYWISPITWRFLWSNATLVHFNSLPGTFSSNIAGDGVNGSIWTLRLEVGMYAATFLFGVLGVWKSRPLTLVVSLLLILWCALMPTTFIFYLHSVSWVLFSVLCYVVGAAIYVLRLSQRTLYAALIAVLIAFCAAILAEFDVRVPRVLAAIALTLGAIWIGRMDSVVLRSTTHWGDLSYGVFLYSAPIQQLLVWANPSPSSAFVLLGSAVISLLMAMVSWRFVERPMLNLKQAHTPTQPQVVAGGR